MEEPMLHPYEEILGSYIQIGGEIMRVASSTLSGGGGDEITVIRGSLGTNTETHLINSRIKKVKPLPIELRRPSILRSQDIHLNMLVLVQNIQLHYHSYKIGH